MIMCTLPSDELRGTVLGELQAVEQSSNARGAEEHAEKACLVLQGSTSSEVRRPKGVPQSSSCCTGGAGPTTLPHAERPALGKEEHAPQEEKKHGCELGLPLPATGDAAVTGT